MGEERAAWLSDNAQCWVLCLSLGLIDWGEPQGRNLPATINISTEY